MNPRSRPCKISAPIKHVHIKDSVIQDGRLVYRLMGDGDLPIADMMMALRSINYEGYVSLEWVRYWNRDMYDAGVVFPQYIHYMEAFMDKPVVDRKLYTAHTGKGQYVWPHNKLIDLTFPQVLDRMVQEFPDQICFDYSELDYKRTYSQFRDDVDTFARALIAMGVKRGDHVAIWATNVPQWYITFWATTKIGAVLVTVNTAYKIHEAEYLLRQSDTHTLVMIDGYKDSDYVGIIKELCPELAGHDPKRPLHTHRLPFLRNVITCESAQEGCYSWNSALERAEEVPVQEVQLRAMSIDKHDVCNMQYTSGTTGFPKGVMLTHYNVVNNGKAIGDCMDLSTADRMMIQVPMFHCFGMVLAMTASMTHGAMMSPITAFSPRKGLQLHQRKADHGLPRRAHDVHRHAGASGFCPHRFFAYAHRHHGGQPLPDQGHAGRGDQDAHERNLHHLRPDRGVPRHHDVQDHRPAGGARQHRRRRDLRRGMQDRRSETGEELPDNTDGEFVARGYNIMKGYYKMPTATAAAIDEEGWLHSGDLARRDENGRFKITGRIKDMIIRGGREYLSQGD